jgi:hypothetical protein
VLSSPELLLSVVTYSLPGRYNYLQNSFEQVQVFPQKALIYHYKQLFQQNLTYLYPSIVNSFFLVQLTDELAGVVDWILLLALSVCPDVEDHTK